MPRSHRRYRHRFSRTLTVPVGDRVPALQTFTPAPCRPALSPAAPRTAKDVLAVLLASTGLTLAARRDARVELLPGTPVTIVISVGGQARAALVLPVAEDEARKLVGKPARQHRDTGVDALWEEDRTADLLQPDVELERQRELAWANCYPS